MSQETNPIIPLYWWNRRENFGDGLGAELLRFFGAQATWVEPAKASLVVVGSILEHLPPDWNGTIAGVGKLFEHSKVRLPRARILAVRGALTAEALTARQLGGDPVLGDPGLLVADLQKPQEPRYDVGVVPHWSDRELPLRTPGHLIRPDRPPLEVLREIAACRLIVSSSLHGLIAADSFGIPRRAELFPQASREGGRFKFDDYASALNQIIRFGEIQEVPRDKVETIKAALREVLRDIASRTVSR